MHTLAYGKCGHTTKTPYVRHKQQLKRECGKKQQIENKNKSRRDGEVCEVSVCEREHEKSLFQNALTHFTVSKLKLQKHYERII